MSAVSHHRSPAGLRPLSIERNCLSAAPGSVLIKGGNTTVLCTASIDPQVPAWRQGSGSGWITAEYNMLPGSTAPRKARDRGAKLDGRTSEIQRLIGRSLRAVADLRRLGERTVTVDCDVLHADGGTRTLSITGGLVALVDALQSLEVASSEGIRFPLSECVAAVSVALVRSQVVLDPDYAADVAAEVDMNVVMTSAGRYVEIQGTGEKSTFSGEQLESMLATARRGIDEIVAQQRLALGGDWPWGA